MKNKFKRWIKVIVILTISLSCILGVILPYLNQKYYFQRLSLDEIAAIQVHSTRFVNEELPAKPLDYDDMLAVYELLSQVKLKGFGTTEFRNYYPMWTQMFLIELTDGTTIEFAATYPFYIIDIKAGYRAERTLCKELEQLFYSLSAEYYPQ